MSVLGRFLREEDGGLSLLRPTPRRYLYREDVGTGAAFSVQWVGLTAGAAEIGTHASIGYTIDPDNGTDTVKWSNSSDPAAAATYGTGANPTDLTAGDGGTLYVHVTDGAETVTRSAPIRYAVAVNTVAPVASGTTALGDTLSSTNGTWTGAVGGAYSYQWQRNGVDIAGATSSTYNIVVADSAADVRCVVTYTNSGGAASANSNAITVDTFTAPVIASVPTIAGTLEVGQTLTATASSVTGNPPPARTWQWERDGTPIGGATASTYTLVGADEVATLTVVQTETNAVGVDTAESAATGTVYYPAPTATGGIADQVWERGTGAQTLAGATVAADFTFSGTRVYSLISPPTGVTINTSTGAVTWDTDVLSVQTGTVLTVRCEDANNAARFAESGFDFEIEDVPDAFVDADWSVATGAGASQLSVTVTTEPTNNFNAITDVEYDVDGGGTWTSLPSYAGPGSYTITMGAASTSYAIRLRAVNGVGTGPVGNSESATSGASSGAAVISLSGFNDTTDTGTLYTDMPGQGNWIIATSLQTQTLTADGAGGFTGGTTLETFTQAVGASGSTLDLATTATTGDGARRIHVYQRIGSSDSNLVTQDYTADNTALSFSSGNPADDATGVAVDANIVATMTETVGAGTGGEFSLYRGATLVETFDGNAGTGDNGGTIALSTNTVTVNPGVDMQAGAAHSLQWNAGAVTDQTRNPIAANSTSTLYNWTTTAASNIAIVNSSQHTTSATFTTYAPTAGFSVTGGANNCLVALVLFQKAGTGTSTLSAAPTWNGTSMTQAALAETTNGLTWAFVYYLMNPASGANAFSATASNNQDAATVHLVELSGVNATNPINPSSTTATVATLTAASSWAASLTTAVANEFGLGIWGNRDPRSATAQTITGGGTELYGGTTGAAWLDDIEYVSGYQLFTASGTNGFTFTTTNSDDNAGALVPFNPA